MDSSTSTGAQGENSGNGSKSIIVVGAGLAGSLLAVYLAKRGYKVDVYERREDIRTAEIVEGRSINLALSTRGLTALEKAGMGHIGRQLGTPMYGRIIHAQEEDPKLQFQQYGVDPKQHLMSISRTVLNERLITAAEEYPLVKFHFKHRCLKTDFAKTSIQFLNEETGETVTATADVILGSDGAYSSVRAALQKTQYFNFSQYFLDHAYKELTLSPAADGSYQLPSNGLHIWPRENFMLIGLPNLDKSFTITLFMPVKMFESLQTKEDVRRFFSTYFPDALRLMPNVPDQYFAKPTGSLVWIKCDPHHKDHVAILGDAAHAMVPFYDQGMNCCFEDVRVLDELLEKYHDDWDQVLPALTATRTKNTDAICQLSYRNYKEMSSHVSHADYLLRKKFDTMMNYFFPASWIPLYSMVTFSNIPYSEVIERSEWQDRVVGKIKTAAPVVALGAASLLALYFPRSRALVRQALTSLADRL